MTAALKTGPHSGRLKELCLCYFIHKNVRRWLGDSWHRDDTGSWGPRHSAGLGSSRCCWHTGRSSSVELLEGELSASASSGCPGIKCGVQQQRAVTAALGIASVRVRGWNLVTGKQRRTRWGSSLAQLPEWSKHARLSLMWAPGHGENAALEQHISPCGVFSLSV